MQTPLQLDIYSYQIYTYKGFVNAKNNIKTKKFDHCFCQYLKNNITDIRLIHLDHVTYAP